MWLSQIDLEFKTSLQKRFIIKNKEGEGNFAIKLVYVK